MQMVNTPGIPLLLMANAIWVKYLHCIGQTGHVVNALHFFYNYLNYSRLNYTEHALSVKTWNLSSATDKFNLLE